MSKCEIRQVKKPHRCALCGRIIRPLSWALCFIEFDGSSQTYVTTYYCPKWGCHLEPVEQLEFDLP